MRHIRSWVGGAALLALTAGPSPAQTPLPALTTGVLAALCGATQAETDGSTAIGYCRGFIVGMGQYHIEITRAGGLRPVFCLPTPTPTLEFVQTSFVAWVNANPQYAGDRAVDGLLRWASTTYPCAAPAAASRRAGQR